MNTFKGTPGPLSFAEGYDADYEIHAEVDGDPFRIWVATIKGCQTSPQQTLANAKLFSASKQMMEALQELMRFENVMTRAADMLQFSDNYVEAITACKAAISAALD